MLIAKAIANSHCAVWVEDNAPTPPRVWVNQNAYRAILGRDPAVLLDRPADWLQAIEPLDRLALSDLLSQEIGFRVILRLAGDQGRVEVQRPDWWGGTKGQRYRMFIARRVPELPVGTTKAPLPALDVDTLDLLLRGSARGVALLDQSFRILQANLAFAARLGRAASDLDRANWFQLIHEDDRQLVTLSIRELDQEHPWTPARARIEHRFAREGQGPVWVRTDLTRVQLPGHLEPSFLAVSVDLTGQRQVNEHNDRRTVRQDAIAELARIALTIHDMDTVADHAVGLLADALETDSASLFQLDQDHGDRLILRAAHGWTAQDVGNAELLLRPDNSLSWHFASPTGQVLESLQPDGYFAPSDAMAGIERSNSLSVVVGSGQRPHGLLAVHRSSGQRFQRSDAAVLHAFGSILAAAVERERQSDHLQRSEERLELSLHSAGLGLWEWHFGTDKIVIDERAAKIMGVESELESHSPDTWLDRFHPADQPRLQRLVAQSLMESTGRSSEEVRVRNGDGWSWVLMAGRAQRRETGRRLSRFLGVIMDVGPRKALEEQLQQSQKIEGLGRLAGGVAHDFNNLLTAIMGHAEITRMQLPPEHPLQRDIEAILDAGNRAAGLTNQLLAFARRQDTEPRFICLKSLLSDLQPLLRSLLDDDISLRVTLEEGLPPVRVDPVQMEQVIVNLVVNAADAMPDGGALQIQLSLASAGEGGQILPDHSGDGVLLTVTDSGSGIPTEVQGKIFEPFFTTKDPGRGTGLGLSTCYGIVTQAKGEMEVSSTPGEGTEFRVTLPGFADEVATPLVLGKGVSSDDDNAEAPASIVLVEDEASVRKLSVESLKRQGHEVFSAADGDQALAVAEACPDGMDLLITDVVMPGLSGPRLAEKLRALHPTVPVLYLSGHVGTHMMPEEDPDNRNWFLRKPFTGSSLNRKVAAVLRQVREEGGA